MSVPARGDATAAPQGLIARFQSGDRLALSRLLSHVENHTEVGRAALRALFGASGRAHVVGITGPPGAGKSTLVNRLIAVWRRRERTVAVVAVDPSSSLTGGATLGDRVRMMETHDDKGVFVRSMATRGNLGGLGRATRGMVWLLDAFGFDLVLIETVGVGQDEVEVARAAHTTILLQVPGLGDDIQAIKAGILEVADLLVINKADRPGAGELKRDLAMMLTLGARPEPGAWRVPILETSATRDEGITELADAIERHRDHLRSSGALAARERSTAFDEVQALVRGDITAQVARLFRDDPAFDDLLSRLVARELDPISAAEQVASAAAARLAG